MLQKSVFFVVFGFCKSAIINADVHDDDVSVDDSFNIFIPEQLIVLDVSYYFTDK